MCLGWNCLSLAPVAALASLCDAGGVLEAAVVAVALAAKSPPPREFLSTDPHRHRVTITLIASYDGENSGFNFDGYSQYLMWTVPEGWTVRVVCKNRGPLRHSCAVVHGANSATPAFRGAEIPHPQIGLEDGHTARFTFRASRKGVYRFACLVPGHETARMWDVLKIVRHGRPSVVDLQTR
jgi:FtsP/CotA-like multicopper oxidase with cupredoxin domain